jgi:hypothetical protein
MNLKEFHDFVDGIYLLEGDGYENLSLNLERLSLREMLNFLEFYQMRRTQLCVPRHLAAAYLINEGVFDDEDFLVYTESIGMLPSKVFEDVSFDPNKLLDHIECKAILELDTYPFSAAIVKTGQKKFPIEWKRESKNILAKIPCLGIDGIIRKNPGMDPFQKKWIEMLIPRLFQIYSGKVSMG